MGYSSRDGYGTAAELVGMSSAEYESVVKRNTYANTDDVAPAMYEVPVQDITQYEVVNRAHHFCRDV